MTETSYHPLDQCLPRRLYRLDSRNLKAGVYDGQEGFKGIREKFGDRFVFTEFHWDQGPPYGTVRPLEDLGVDLPAGIPLEEYLGYVDRATTRPVYFDRPIADGGRGWCFVGGAPSQDIRAVGLYNQALHDWLETQERDPRT